MSEPRIVRVQSSSTHKRATVADNPAPASPSVELVAPSAELTAAESDASVAPAASSAAAPAAVPAAVESDRSCIPPPLRTSLASGLECLNGAPSASMAAAASSASPAAAAAASSSPAAAAAPKPPAAAPGVTAQQKDLLHAILHAKVEDLLIKYDQVDWNFAHKVVGRTAPQSPLALLLRPELNYGNLSRMTRKVQRQLVEHALSLEVGFTPRLDSREHPHGPFFRQSMSMHVIQAVYQGRVDLMELLYETSLERARQGTGEAFNLRDVFFPSRITLLHMAAHDGQLDMARWILARWAEERERDPGNPLNEKFHADVEDGAGQTPLFWTFARGTVSVDLARFFVEEHGCDLFRVFPLKTRVPKLDKAGKAVTRIKTPAVVDAAGAVTKPAVMEPVMLDRFDGWASAFSLGIHLAPDFVESCLHSKATNMGTRFQKSVMRFDFAGITLRQSQIEAIQIGVDELNASHADQPAADLEGKKFLEAANKQLDEFLSKRESNGQAVASAEAASGESAAIGVDQPRDGALLHGSLDVSELRFVSQEAQGSRAPKERWDTFFYGSQPRSALEIMVAHRRRRMLLTGIMREIMARIWTDLKQEYYLLSAGFMLFGLCFAIHTALWPRTPEMLGSNIALPLPAGTSVSNWLFWFFFNNIVCAALIMVLVAFYAKVAYEGPYLLPASKWNFKAALWTCVRNVGYAFRSSSAQLDCLIAATFVVVQAVQWSLICHVPQFAAQKVCEGDQAELNGNTVATLAWMMVLLHLLIGLKLLELLSVVAWAGPLFSTLVNMVRDVARFIALFGVCFAAFACASWVALKDVYHTVNPALELGGASAAAAALGADHVAAHYTYTSSWTENLLWVFLSFDFPGFGHTAVPGISSLARVVFLSFMCILVLVMLNLMIAMFSNTYANVVKEAEGESALRRAALACQLLRMAGAKSSSTRRFVTGMGVANNCGIDRDAHSDDYAMSSGADGSSGGGGARGGGGLSSGEGGWAETMNDYFLSMSQTLSKVRGELGAIKSQMAERDAEMKKMQAHQARTMIAITTQGANGSAAMADIANMQGRE